MRCEDVLLQLWEYLDEDLAPEEARTVRAHLGVALAVIQHIAATVLSSSCCLDSARRVRRRTGWCCIYASYVSPEAAHRGSSLSSLFAHRFFYPSEIPGFSADDRHHDDLGDIVWV